MKNLLHTLAVAGLVVGLITASGTSFAQTQAQTARPRARGGEPQTRSGLLRSGVRQHEVEKAALVLADDYIQHNPLVPTGKATVREFLHRILQGQPSGQGAYAA